MSESGGWVRTAVEWGFLVPAQALACGFLVGVAIKLTEMAARALFPGSATTAARTVALVWFLLLAVISAWVFRRLWFIYKLDKDSIVPGSMRVSALLCIFAAWFVWSALCI